MLDWLKNLFWGGGGRPRKVLDVEAHLAAADPTSALHGDGEYEAWDDGSWSFEVEVEGPDGTQAPAGITAFVDGVEIGTLVPRGDEAELKLSSRAGDTIAKTPAEGSTLEVRGPGGEQLSGTFRTDR